MTGGELRRRRRAAGVTQQQVADEAGVTKSYVSLVETGHPKAHDPSIEIYVRLLNGVETARVKRDPIYRPYRYLAIIERRAS